MHDVTGRHQRMRYAFETRCRAVAAMVAGVRPGVAAQTVGASRVTGYRWWRRYAIKGVDRQLVIHVAGLERLGGRYDRDVGQRDTG